MQLAIFPNIDSELLVGGFPPLLAYLAPQNRATWSIDKLKVCNVDGQLGFVVRNHLIEVVSSGREKEVREDVCIVLTRCSRFEPAQADRLAPVRAS
jgi:hypothetical protein